MMNLILSVDSFLYPNELNLGQIKQLEFLNKTQYHNSVTDFSYKGLQFTMCSITGVKTLFNKDNSCK